MNRHGHSRPSRRLVRLAGGIVALGGLGVLAAVLLVSMQSPPRLAAASPLDPNLGVEDPVAASSLGLRKQVDHPVTSEMSQAAASLGELRSPEFSLRDGEGHVYTLATLSKGKPVLIFFIEKECPCCLGAKFFVNELARIHADTAVVVGIINTSGQGASKWVQAARPKFLVLEDPDQQAISAFKAERGVYTTIVRPDGVIERAYPGYSREVVNDMSLRLSRLAGVESRPFLSKEAPERMTSGCLFPESIETN